MNTVLFRPRLIASNKKDPVSLSRRCTVKKMYF